MSKLSVSSTMGGGNGGGDGKGMNGVGVGNDGCVYIECSFRAD